MAESIEPHTSRRQIRPALRDRMKGFLLFLPNLVKLLSRLLKDARVPAAEKALFIAAIIYVLSPLDFIPDVFPFIGQVDDLYVVALTLLRLVNRTDESIVREHWAGGGDIVALAESIANIAPKFLPKRVANILTTRIELAPAAKALTHVDARDKELIRIVPEEEESAQRVR
jgi:uncharacterized membrane protein YkvA (DUF1232 family)